MDENKPSGHERSDVNALVVGKFAIALVLVCILSLTLLAGLFRYFLTQTGPPPPQAAKLPPEPRLEVQPAQDLMKVRQAEEQLLTSYGWVDQPKGVVRIPISLAIDLLARRGLPARQQPGPQAAAGDVSMPTEAGLGPKAQQPGGPLAQELNQ